MVFVGKVSEGGDVAVAHQHKIGHLPRSLTRIVFLILFFFVCVLICTLTDFSCCMHACILSVCHCLFSDYARHYLLKMGGHGAR